MAKIGGQYVNSQNLVMEAVDNGFVEGIGLDANDRVSEGSGENIFLVIDDRIYTPPMAGSILHGITRDSAITIAQGKGFEVREEFISREMLYLADEIFFSGTAAEITPVRSVDRMPVGSGRRGPITAEIQAAFFGIVEGRSTRRMGLARGRSRLIDLEESCPTRSLGMWICPTSSLTGPGI